jgi:hypothetical protein
MKVAWFAFPCMALLGIPSARAQEGAGLIEGGLARPSAAAPVVQAAQPASVAPTQEPPAPPAEPPPLKIKGKKKAAKASAAAQAVASEPDNQVVYSLGSVTVAIPTPSQEPTRIGQWVYTAQHGWLYMPYGQQYVTEGTGDDTATYEYAYSPSYGWNWVQAPWVSGLGPYPYYGTVGAGSYVWSSQAYSRYYSVGLRPSPYDLNYNYYGTPLNPAPLRVPVGSRAGQTSGLAARTPAHSTPAVYPGFRSGLLSPISPRSSGGSFPGSGSYFGGSHRSSSSLGGGSSSLGGGSRLGDSHGGSSTLGGGSVFHGSGSSLSGGSSSSMGSRGGNSSSGHSSGASVGRRH